MKNMNKLAFMDNQELYEVTKSSGETVTVTVVIFTSNYE
jgi:hypothetical protein